MCAASREGDEADARSEAGVRGHFNTIDLRHQHSAIRGRDLRSVRRNEGIARGRVMLSRLSSLGPRRG